MTDERPIGYWLKAADRAITAAVDAAQRENGVTRLEWQVLNTIHGATTTNADEIAAALQIFADRPTLDVLLEELRGRGWIDDDEESIRLSEEGGRVHARVLDRQREIRQRATEGITREEYETTLRVLQRVVSNLEGAGS